MLTNFDDFCLWVYVVVDDIWQQIAPLMKRPGPAPTCTDSELIAMILIAECRGWDVETEALAQWKDYPHLFPRIPSQSRYNRRRRYLGSAINLMRQLLLRDLDLAQDRQCVIDSLPVPVVKFHLAPQAGGDWAAHGAAFGRVPSKKQTIFGYKLHLLVTLGGVILDAELAPANVNDLEVGVELLEEHEHLEVIGDKAYVSAPAAEDLQRRHDIRLRTLPRANQKRQLPPAVAQLYNSVRQIVETVNSQLVGQFHIETNLAHTFYGLVARIASKLTAHTLCIYINRLLGNPEPLQIKALAFPN